MIQLAIAILRLPDASIVLQRRDAEARVSPGKLGFFGGHVEPGETPGQAIARELEEETSLKASALNIEHVAEFQLESDADEGMLNFNIYEANIPDANFEVLEGQHAEVYAVDTLLSRSDLTTSARYVFEKVVKV